MEKSSLKPGHLRRIKSLALLNEEQLAAILNYVDVVNCAQAKTLFLEGQPGDSMFLILEGQMRVFTTPRSGQSLFLRMLEAGDVFGEVAQFLYHVARAVGRQLSDLTVKLRARREQDDVLSLLH